MITGGSRFTRWCCLYSTPSSWQLYWAFDVAVLRAAAGLEALWYGLRNMPTLHESYLSNDVNEITAWVVLTTYVNTMVHRLCQPTNVSIIHTPGHHSRMSRPSTNKDRRTYTSLLQRMRPRQRHRDLSLSTRKTKLIPAPEHFPPMLQPTIHQMPSTYAASHSSSWSERGPINPRCWWRCTINQQLPHMGRYSGMKLCDSRFWVHRIEACKNLGYVLGREIDKIRPLEAARRVHEYD